MSKLASKDVAGASRSQTIAELNDKLRKTGKGGSIVVTAGLQRVTGFNPQLLMSKLATYDGFDSDNDPHGERDFGDLTLWGYDLLWKIDYFDTDLTYGSDDPADADVTMRVLTVLLASEW